MKLLTAAIAAISIAAQGPGRGPAQTQSPRPLVGETMPIGGDIARTIHFYHDLLGLQCRSGDPRARLGWYDTRPFLEDMYAVVGGQLRNVTFLVPGAPLFMAGEVSTRWELWRALTSTLPHVNVFHLVFDLYWLSPFVYTCCFHGSDSPLFVVLRNLLFARRGAACRALSGRPIRPYC